MNSKQLSKFVVAIAFITCCLLTAAQAYCEQAVIPYIDRARWFQMNVPADWQAIPGEKGKPVVLTVKNATFPKARLTLQIEPAKDLPELITREELLEHAKKLLEKTDSGVTPVSIKEVSGLPMTGLIAEFDNAAEHSRTTILIDPPRKRAFVWTASAPADLFPAYDSAFNEIVGSMIPVVPEN